MVSPEGSEAEENEDGDVLERALCGSLAASKKTSRKKKAVELESEVVLTDDDEAFKDHAVGKDDRLSERAKERRRAELAAAAAAKAKTAKVAVRSRSRSPSPEPKAAKSSKKAASSRGGSPSPKRPHGHLERCQQAQPEVCPRCCPLAAA